MKKFTLIELLVVISILGILVSLLLPSLKMARVKAEMAVCGSNQSQIYKQSLLWASHNADWLPYGWREDKYKFAYGMTWESELLVVELKKSLLLLPGSQEI